MLAIVWVYAYTQGISSAREIERQMVYEPGLMWLSGANAVNHHTLSDFRVDHKDALDQLFQQLLAVLEGEGFLNLSQVMHDGTKVRANAGVDTFRRKKTIQERHNRREVERAWSGGRVSTRIILERRAQTHPRQAMVEPRIRPQTVPLWSDSKMN